MQTLRDHGRCPGAGNECIALERRGWIRRAEPSPPWQITDGGHSLLERALQTGDPVHPEWVRLAVDEESGLLLVRTTDDPLSHAVIEVNMVGRVRRVLLEVAGRDTATKVFEFENERLRQIRLYNRRG